MINPDKLYRLKQAKIVALGSFGSIRCQTREGNHVDGWVENQNELSMGQIVNLQIRYSIMLDQFVIKTANKIRTKKGNK